MGAPQHAQETTDPPKEEAPRPKPNGYCWNCCLRVDDGIVFCEPFCERQYAIQHPEGRDN